MNNDLISREALLSKLVNLVEYDEGGWDINTPAVKLEDIEILPTVDAVEVVRCKDCIYWGQGICNLFSEEPDCRYSGHYVHTDPEAFCSYGEKEGIDYEEV